MALLSCGMPVDYDHASTGIRNNPCLTAALEISSRLFGLAYDRLVRDDHLRLSGPILFPFRTIPVRRHRRFFALRRAFDRPWRHDRLHLERMLCGPPPSDRMRESGTRRPPRSGLIHSCCTTLKKSIWLGQRKQTSKPTWQTTR
jgi:hypothetical protein